MNTLISFNLILYNEQLLEYIFYCKTLVGFISATQ
jgi:hypothetical protein